MTQKTSVGARTAMTIARVFGTMGLTLGLLLGILGILQPAAARPIVLGNVELLTPAAVGDNLERATPEGFTEVGYGGHRGHRHGFAKGGHGFRDHRVGGYGFAKRRFFGHGFRSHLFGGHGFRKRRFFGHGFRSHRFGGYGFGKHGFKRYN